MTHVNGVLGEGESNLCGLQDQATPHAISQCRQVWKSCHFSPKTPCAQAITDFCLITNPKWRCREVYPEQVPEVRHRARAQAKRWAPDTLVQ